MSDIKQRILDDVKQAMRAQDKQRLSVLRLISAAIKQYEVDKQTQVTDTELLSILDKMQKQRKDSLQQYQAAGREDLANQEEYELSVIKEYLPQQLTEAELAQLIEKAIAETGANGMADMGKVMAILKPQCQGRADMAELSKKIKSSLT